MPAPYNIVDFKLERAICAWLVEQGCGSWDDIFPSISVKDRKYPCTTVTAVSMKEESNAEGVERLTVQISNKGSAAKDPNDADAQDPITAFNNRRGSVNDALMQSDDNQTLRFTALGITAAGRAMAVAVDGSDGAKQFAADNADMVDFACTGWYDKGAGLGQADEEGCAWNRVLIFEALACGSNVD